MCRPEHVKRTDFLFGFPSPDGCYKVRSYDKTKANQPKGPFSRGKDKKKKKKKELKGRFARTRPAFETHHKIV